MTGNLTQLLSFASVMKSIGGVVLAVVILLAMVTIHEFGHYLAGKALNFKINEFSVGFGPALFKKRNKKTGELFAHDISEVMESIVRAELETASKPVSYMQKEDKLAVVEGLENRGIFDVKGSVEYVAERLGVTNFTIYNYLKEIRYTKK